MLVYIIFLIDYITWLYRPSEHVLRYHYTVEKNAIKVEFLHSTEWLC